MMRDTSYVGSDQNLVCTILYSCELTVIEQSHGDPYSLKVMLGNSKVQVVHWIHSKHNWGVEIREIQ